VITGFEGVVDDGKDSVRRYLFEEAGQRGGIHEGQEQRAEGEVGEGGDERVSIRHL
jgi:hypothetical protein